MSVAGHGVRHTRGVRDALYIVVPIAVCVGMLWLAARIEPHWVAKDGSRFLTTSQIIDRQGAPLGRRRELRVAIQRDGTLLASRRSLLRTNSETFRLAGKSSNPPRRKQIYLLEPIPPDADGVQMTLRVPAKSRVVSELDRILGLSARGSPGWGPPTGPG